MNKTALITGASSGIGHELCKLFAADKFDLVIVSRDKMKLDEIAEQLGEQHGIKITPVAKDLSVADSADELFGELERMSIKIDILVNNAGFGLYGPFDKASYKTIVEMMQLNMVSLTKLTRLILPGMILRGSGRILNVASTAAFQPGPLMAVYYATKAYVLSFSEALADELSESNITVTALCPGPTFTGFLKRAGVENSPLFRKWNLMSSEKVALAGYRGLLKGKTIVIPGIRNKLLALVIKLLPRKQVVKIVRRIQETRR